jgi:hypothetical protein
MNYFDSIYAYLGFLYHFHESADQNEKISQAQKYRNNRYFLPVSILFFKTLVSIVSSFGIDIGPSLGSTAIFKYMHHKLAKEIEFWVEL